MRIHHRQDISEEDMAAVIDTHFLWRRAFWVTIFFYLVVIYPAVNFCFQVTAN